MPSRVREERPRDYDAIEEITRRAFGGEEEVRLIRDLRRDGDLFLSLISESHGAIVGHIGFSRMFIDTGLLQIRALALAPVAVDPDYQNRGIGSDLIKTGLDRCLAAGERIVIVLGHPNYYPRFGFSAEAASTIENPFNAPAAWMALELCRGVLKGVSGRARYAKAFALPPEWTASRA